MPDRLARYACLSCVPPKGYGHLIFTDGEIARIHLLEFPSHFMVCEDSAIQMMWADVNEHEAKKADNA